MGLIIDSSGSMRDKRLRVAAASMDLVKASNPQDEVFIVDFNDDAYLDQPFTNDSKTQAFGHRRAVWHPFFCHSVPCDTP